MSSSHSTGQAQSQGAPLHRALLCSALLGCNPQQVLGLLPTLGQPPELSTGCSKGRGWLLSAGTIIRPVSLHSCSVRVQAPCAGEGFLFVTAALSVMFSFPKGSGNGQTGCIRSCNVHCSSGNCQLTILTYVMWEGTLDVLQVLWEGGMEFTDLYLKHTNQSKQPTLWMKPFSTTIFTGCGEIGGWQGFILVCGSCIIQVACACCCPGQWQF